MLSRSQVGRKLSNKLRQTTKTLYSANDSISDTLMNKVKKESEKMRSYQIYYVDEPGTVKDIENTILYFSENIAKGKWLIVILDHTLLVDGLTGENALKTISDLQKMFIRVKKLPFTSIIQVSQMNRNIEAPDRINNPSNHYPMRSDISSADTIFHASDYVMVLHRPELLGILSYGIKHLQVKNKVYLHILKNRDAGEPAILEFENDLKYNNLIETTDEKKEIIFNNKNLG